MSALIEIRNAVMQYASQDGIKDVSAEIRQGEFFVIIGPNGAGKTTLLKTLSGLSPLDQGNILVRGKSLAGYTRKELARLLALVPQYVSIDFPFTVAETVLMGRYPHTGFLGIEGKQDIALARQAMEFTEVEHLADRRMNQLSGGERQRVIIARALCQQPEILLLDEPTASLDPAHQLHIMDLMERIRQQEQVTVVMVSHDLNLAAAYADRLMLMKNGKVERIGTPEEVLTEAQLAQSYGCDLLVDVNPVLNTPRVSLVSDTVRTKNES